MDALLTLSLTVGFSKLTVAELTADPFQDQQFRQEVREGLASGLGLNSSQVRAICRDTWSIELMAPTMSPAASSLYV